MLKKVTYIYYVSTESTIHKGNLDPFLVHLGLTIPKLFQSTEFFILRNTI